MLKFLFLLFWIGMHPVHVAFISMEYSAELEAFKTFIKIYSDDFILDYISLSEDNQQIDFSQKNNAVKEKINNYLNDKIELYADSLKIEGQVQDFESADGELKVNLLYRTVKKPKIFKVKCRILTDIYNDQANFLIFRYNDYEEGVKLTSENKEQTFEVE